MKRSYIFIGGFLIFILIITIVGSNIVTGNTSIKKEKDILSVQSNKEVYFNGYGYSLDNPNVIINPYGNSPLTGIAMFETSDYSEVSISVNGDINYTFGKNKHHIIPIYGLYADYDNTIVLRSENKEKVINIKTDKLPDDFDERTYVMDLDECSAYFRDELGINTDATTMRQTAVDIMTRHYSTDIPAKDGMLELIRREHEAGSDMCIFTSSDRSCVDAALNRLGIADCFNNIFTVYDIPYNKKNPESYKLIAEKMHFKPEDTWVYEDVLHGIESARQGGFKICAVYDEDSKKHWNEICALADEIRDIRND